MGDGMRVDGQSWSRLDLERHNAGLEAVASVRAVELQEGSERGVRVVEFRNGAGLAFDVLVDRAMDIGSAGFQGRQFAWHSGTGFRHPGLHEYSDEGGVSWLRSFSGLTVTAGLDHTLFTTVSDASHHHYPHRQTVWNGLHGRVANIPARLVGHGVEHREDEVVLWAEGEVTQAAVFGENIRLSRRIECDADGHEIRLLDRVRNLGFDRQPHMFLYHINFGWPLIEEGTRFVAPIHETKWQSDSVDEQGVSHVTIPGPQPDFVEQVYEHRLAADKDGYTSAMLINDRLEWALEVTWRLDQFPFFFQWMHLREGAYAVALEPSTNDVQGRLAAEEDETLIWLRHGEERVYETHFNVHTSRTTIADAEERCARRGSM